MSSAHANPFVREIAPYMPGKPISELARELGIDPIDIIKLASNENPLGPSPKVVEALRAGLADLTLYPDGSGFDLRNALMKRWGVKSDEVILGNGSNDVLEMVAAAFLRPGTAAVFSQYAFAVYPLATKARGARGIEVPAVAWGHDLPSMLAAIDEDTRLIFVANPNNPTGTFLSSTAVREFLKEVPREVIVVLDEAYYEYLPEADRSGAEAWIHEFPNLLVVRTFSKAYGLAGLRVGYGIGQAELIDLLNRVRQPFNVGSLGLVAATAALADEEYVQRTQTLNAVEMERLASSLDRLGFPFIPSRGNFITVEVGDAHAVFNALLRQGVIVRPVAGYGMPRHLRVSIGLPEENDRFIAALRAASKEQQ